MDINKKLLMLALFAVFSLAACGDSDDDESASATPAEIPATTTLTVEQLERNPEKMKASNSSYMGPSLGTPSGGGAR